MNRKKLSGILALVFMLLAFCHGTLAAESTDFPFLATAHIPANQVTAEHSFFNLLMEPSQHQILEVSLRNYTLEDLVLIPQITAATTTDEGVVEYNPARRPDPTLRHDIASIVSALDEEVVVPALGYGRMMLEVQMPDENFEGVVAGGLILNTKDETPYTFILGIILRTNVVEVEPELLLTSVYMDIVEDDFNVLRARISNVKPMFMNQVTVHIEITRRGDIVYEETISGLHMAPYTSMDYGIVTDDVLGTGNYVLNLTVESEHKSWSWTRGISLNRDGTVQVTDDVEGGRGIGITVVVIVIIFVLLGLGLFIARTVIIRQRKAESRKVAEILKSVGKNN